MNLPRKEAPGGAIKRHVTFDANFCIREFLSRGNDARPSYPVGGGFMPGEHVTSDHDASRMQRS